MSINRVENKNRYSIKSCVIAGVYIILVIQIGILSFLPQDSCAYKLIQYFDDVVECIAAVIIAVTVFAGTKRFMKVEYAMMAFAALYTVIGLISSLVYRYRSIYISLTDLLICVRFVVLYFAARIIISDRKGNQEVLSIISGFCKILLSVFALICLHELIAINPFFERYDFRYFSYSMKLFFGTQSEFGACMFCLAMPVILSGEISKQNIQNIFFSVIGLLLAILCQRAKTMAAAVFALGVFILFCLLKVKRNRLIDSVVALATLVGAFVFGRDRIISFYMNKKMARGMMLRDSIALANEHFPLGTGFGSYGTNTAFKNWSPLYERFGYPYGIEVYDVFWPGVIAQFGWVGTFSFLAVILCMTVMAFKLSKKSEYLFVTAISIVFCILCSSMGESAFFHPMYNSLFILFAICVNLFSQMAK